MPMSDQLKAAGAELHKQAETAGFTRQLFGGDRPIEDYGAFLEQMLVIHGALEEAIAGASHPALGTIVDASQDKTPHLRADLVHLGRDPDAVTPLPETQAFAASIRQADPLTLLGIHYVLEGSMNGNRFMAPGIRKAYAFEGEDGTRYLDPYGDEQRARWAEFKQKLDGTAFSDAEQNEIIEADLATFRAIIDIHAALDRTAVTS